VSFLLSFKTIPAVKFSVPVIFIFGTLICSYYTLETWKLNKTNSDLLNQRIQLENSLESANSGNSYENSGLFFERKLKQENFILQGEKVIDTSAVEPFESKPSNFYLPKDVGQQSNLELWVSCLTGQKKFTQSDYNGNCI
jgi:hypothetical protein